jgi:hypothetical protein
MWQNITSVVASICVSGTLMQPAAPNGRISPDSESSPVERADRWTTGATSGTPVALHSASRIRDWQWNAGATLRPRAQVRAPRLPSYHPTQHSGSYRSAQRVLAAFALGFVGFYVGAITTYGLGQGCECGGTSSPYIGGAIGAAAGATAGMLLVR